MLRWLAPDLNPNLNLGNSNQSKLKWFKFSKLNHFEPAGSSTLNSPTVIPVIVAPIDFVTNPSDTHSNLAADGSNWIDDNFRVVNHAPPSSISSIHQRKLVQTVLIYILDFIMAMLLFVYVLARLVLIAQALALLRRQPPNSFLAVDWTRFIPHFWSLSLGDAGQLPNTSVSWSFMNFFLPTVLPKYILITS